MWFSNNPRDRVLVDHACFLFMIYVGLDHD